MNAILLNKTQSKEEILNSLGGLNTEEASTLLQNSQYVKTIKMSNTNYAGPEVNITPARIGAASLASPQFTGTPRVNGYGILNEGTYNIGGQLNYLNITLDDILYTYDVVPSGLYDNWLFIDYKKFIEGIRTNFQNYNYQSNLFTFKVLLLEEETMDIDPQYYIQPSSQADEDVMNDCGIKIIGPHIVWNDNGPETYRLINTITIGGGIRSGRTCNIDVKFNSNTTASHTYTAQFDPTYSYIVNNSDITSRKSILDAINELYSKIAELESKIN